MPNSINDFQQGSVQVNSKQAKVEGEIFSQHPSELQRTPILASSIGTRDAAQRAKGRQYFYYLFLPTRLQQYTCCCSILDG